MPSGEWVVKILNQLPRPIIKLAITHLKRYDRLGNFEKRNIFCSLLNSIKENATISEGQQVLEILSQG